MAIIWYCGFETQLAASESVGGNVLALSGTSAISTAQARTGAASLRCNPASGASGHCVVAIGSSQYVHFGLYVATLPSVDRLIAGQISAGIINLRLTTAGALAVYLNTTLIGTSAATFASPGWHWVGFRCVTGTSVVWLQIDGSDSVTGTATVSNTSGVIGFFGTEASAVDAYFDDIILNDSTGFLAPSKCDFMFPISDNTVTGVTDGNGGTSNLWDCVNNAPPAGVASANEAANPAVNIRFPASTTESYIANLETYTTIGIAASDTVLAVSGLIRHGEDIATGTKNGTYVGITNPTVTDSSAFTFGGDTGAHGVDPGGIWISKSGTLTTSPTVTLGTSPTIRVDRASESRVGCIDLMGIHVAWTPAAATYAPPFRHRHPLITR